MLVLAVLYRTVVCERVCIASICSRKRGAARWWGLERCREIIVRALRRGAVDRCAVGVVRWVRILRRRTLCPVMVSPGVGVVRGRRCRGEVCARGRGSGVVARVRVRMLGLRGGKWVDSILPLLVLGLVLGRVWVISVVVSVVLSLVGLGV
jgi:hypothetical protein